MPQCRSLDPSLPEGSSESATGYLVQQWTCLCELVFECHTKVMRQSTLHPVILQDVTCLRNFRNYQRSNALTYKGQLILCLNEPLLPTNVIKAIFCAGPSWCNSIKLASLISDMVSMTGPSNQDHCTPATKERWRQWIHPDFETNGPSYPKSESEDISGPTKWTSVQQFISILR